MTETYDAQGIQFQYPENWTLVDDSSEEMPRTVQVQSPTGAFWSVDIHPFSIDASELMEQVLQAMRIEYPELEAHGVAEEIEGESSVGYDLYFQCLDFIVASRLRSLRFGHATYLIMFQAEDREFDRLEPVFRAITTSLFRA